jgi:hypothetical protein
MNFAPVLGIGASSPTSEIFHGERVFNRALTEE